MFGSGRKSVTLKRKLTHLDPSIQQGKKIQFHIEIEEEKSGKKMQIQTGGFTP